MQSPVLDRDNLAIGDDGDTESGHALVNREQFQSELREARHGERGCEQGDVAPLLHQLLGHDAGHVVVVVFVNDDMP